MYAVSSVCRSTSHSSSAPGHTGGDIAPRCTAVNSTCSVTASEPIPFDPRCCYLVLLGARKQKAAYSTCVPVHITVAQSSTYLVSICFRYTNLPTNIPPPAFRCGFVVCSEGVAVFWYQLVSGALFDILPFDATNFGNAACSADQISEVSTALPPFPNSGNTRDALLTIYPSLLSSSFVQVCIATPKFTVSGQKREKSCCIVSTQKWKFDASKLPPPTDNPGDQRCTRQATSDETCSTTLEGVCRRRRPNLPRRQRTLKVGWLRKLLVTLSPWQAADRSMCVWKM